MKVKFKNTEVSVKKLIQGAVVTICFDDQLFEVYHIHSFIRYNNIDNTIDLVVKGELGKWERNSAELTWPI